MDYNNLDKNIKSQFINQNIYHSKYGVYKHYPLYKPIKLTPSQCAVGIVDINKIPQVYVINKHPLNIVEGLGIANHLPVMVHAVGREFDGTGLHFCNGLRDHTLLLRTNFNAAIGQCNPFPIENTECIYIKTITTIRGPKLNGLTDKQTFKFSLIVAAPLNKPSDQKNKNIMTANNFIKTISIIDTIFKVAIMQHHSILILSNFGDNDEDENPTGDIIKIYNACILKYGHMFSTIIIAIPEYERDLYKIYSSNIVIPKEMCASLSVSG